MSRANRKRKNKGGRPRLENVEREPNGRPLRSQRKTETEAETRKVAVQARARIYGAPEAECVRPEYGSVLGRLYMTGHINKLQLEAGNRTAEDFGRYYGLTGIPHPSAKAQDITRVKGMGGEVSYEAARKATNRVMAIEQALGEVVVQSRSVTSVVKRVCVMDEDLGISETMRAQLVAGLNRLVVFFGVDKMERAA
ncbi:hypothetical protein LJR231_003478 [Phyllobacterium sp. LjRoot231]|uniref:hypothetical protein n=1 Tax=Phyllobacterium sp. LjRoot231 TaxID=3342289 RepID=UPI003ED0CC87